MNATIPPLPTDPNMSSDIYAKSGPWVEEDEEIIKKAKFINMKNKRERERHYLLAL